MIKKNKLTISLIIPRYENMFSTFYTLEIIKELSSAAIALDVDLLIETAWKVSCGSGVLFADIMGNEGWIKKARQKRLPYLILNYYNPDSVDNCIGIDNKKAAFEAVNYLIQAGHRRLAVITGKLNAQAGQQRLEGFKKAISARKIDLDKRYIANGDWSRESGRLAMRKLLSLKEPPTAVFAAGDEMAIGAIETAKEAGLKVSEDISFVGFDNIPQADSPEFSLTTVEQPFAELAESAVKSLIEIIKKKPRRPIRILLDNTKLIKRKSVKDLKK
jgi:DNA-binding LacI/PurR family transcriptional regulator